VVETSTTREGAKGADGLVLLGGIFACSTSVLFIKGSAMHPATLACARLSLAVVLLAPIFVRDLGRHRGVVDRMQLRRGVLPGVLLGLHLISWNEGARMTSAVNASLVVNMVPLVTPLFLLMVAGERVNRGEWLGTLFGAAGIVLLTARDYRMSAEYFTGDAICFVAMLLFALYLVFGRRHRDVPSVFLYVVPLYATAALTCALACLLVDDPLAGAFTPWELAMALGLALVPTVLGHSALNYAMSRFRGQVVTVANLGQPLFAGVMAYCLLSEVPSAEFYIACALIVAGAVVALGGPRALLPRVA
jgi:drug/metabolite transporter (DMT)-like permease